MDSKLLYKTIIGVLGGITLMIAIVIFVNYRSGRLSFREEQPVVVSTSEEMATYAVKTEYGVQVGENLDGFEKDEFFFDGEVKPVKEKEESNYLSMIITSVQRDLRIQVVDSRGELVTGKELLVDIKDVGEYKDLDQDGIIYVADLTPGPYEVSILPIDGYRVSAFPLSVNVKSQLSYEIISDISLLIKNESDINVSEEDTEIIEALEDADDSEIKEAIVTDGKTRLGIDVSKWNGEIDWDLVKGDNISFAIIRCGYRGAKTGALVQDPYFVQNMEGAKKAGLSTGVYFFTQATTELEAVEEASMVLCLIEQYELEYPIFIDTEGAGGNGRADNLDREQRTKVIEAFVETIKNANHEVGVYASRNWFNKNLDVSRLENNVIWLAEYRSEPLYAGNYQLWQYTSSGHLNGIEGRVDLNFSYLGY